MGRNNASDGGKVEQDTTVVVGHLPAGAHFLVLGIINGDYPVERKGASVYMAIRRLNEHLAGTFGANFVPIREDLVALFDRPARDIGDHEHDVPPSSLRADALHLNSQGYARVGAIVSEKIRENGWWAHSRPRGVRAH